MDNAELELRLTGKLNDLRKEVLGEMQKGFSALRNEIMDELREIKERLP